MSDKSVGASLLCWLYSGPDDRFLMGEDVDEVLATGLAVRRDCSDGDYLEPTEAGRELLRNAGCLPAHMEIQQA